MHGRVGTVAFRALEVCKASADGYGLPADIYSFGVLILELALFGKLAAGIPKIEWEDESGKEIRGRCKSVALFARRMAQGQRPSNMEQLLQEGQVKAAAKVMLLAELMRMCTNSDPSKRPKASAVHEILAKVVEADEAEKQTTTKGTFMQASRSRREASSLSTSAKF